LTGVCTEETRAKDDRLGQTGLMHNVKEIAQ